MNKENKSSIPKGLERPEGASVRKVNEMINSGLWYCIRKDVREWYTRETGLNFDKKK